MTVFREEYRFVPWRQTPEGDGYEPAVPAETYCELLAEFGFGQLFDALYLVRWPEKEPEPPGMRGVPDHLAGLLLSARAYPPALAIARDLRFRKEAENWSEAEAVEKYAAALRAELDHQRDRRFFLAKALEEDAPSIYKEPGRYYWIVGYRPAKAEPICWVSDDYFVYTAPAADFDVDLSWLQERFKG